MRVRGFSFVEIAVVVAVIGIAGSIAVFAMSDQVGAAKARSDEIGMFLKLKNERNKARERMQGMTVTTADSGHTVVFHKPIITNVSGVRTCDDGVETSRATFAGATAVVSGTRCIDENGRPIGSFELQIQGKDGRVNDVAITESGQLESNIAKRVDDIDIAHNDELSNTP
jgi:prepilin-type N-terminal cleavage/methylation domain-containing protein